MRVLHIAANLTGGAGLMTRLLHEGLLDYGVDSRALSLNPPPAEVARALWYEDDYFRKAPPYKKIVRIARRAQFTRKKRNLLAGRDHQDAIFSLARSPFPVSEHPEVAAADVVHLHWVAEFVNYPTFFKGLNKPVVWSLRDANPFTGGCHVPDGCDNFKRDCANCPALAGARRTSLAREQLEIKRMALASAKRLHIIAISNGIAEVAGSSLLLKSLPLTVIPNFVEEEVFKPANRTASEKQLNLVSNKLRLLFVAAEPSARGKGLEVAISAFCDLKADFPSLELVIAGNPPNIRQEGVVCLGRITNRTDLAALYNCADVFLIPSVFESFGKVALEAQLCAKPVVAFAAGGLTDIIADQETGVLTPVGEVDKFKAAIHKFLKQPDFAKRCGLAGRKRALKLFDRESILRQHIEVYESAMRGN